MYFCKKLILYLTYFGILIVISWSFFFSKPNSWFDSFFDNIKIQNISSYRLYTLVDRALIEDQEFITQAKMFVHALEKKYNPELLTICLEFWIDNTCSSDQVNKFRSQIGTAPFISYTDLKTLIEKLSATKELPQIIAKNPTSPLSKNILVLWTLDDPFDMNVYLDSQLWKRYFHLSKKGLAASSAFGLSQKIATQDNLGMYYQAPPQDKNSSHVFLLNNKILIGYGQNLSIHFVKKQISQNIIMHPDRAHLALSLPLDFQNIAYNLESYKNDLLNRKIYFEKHPEEIIGDLFWISALSGEIFLEQLREQAIGHPIFLDKNYEHLNIENSFCTAIDKILLRATYSDIQDVFGKKSIDALHRALILSDYHLLCKETNAEITHYIREEILKSL